jgi:excinuclease UvrABC nuclease subunit
MKLFTKENVANEDNRTGVYRFFDNKKNLIYIGHAKQGDYSGIRHRLQSYYQKDDPQEHPTKCALRKKIWYYSVEYFRSTERAKEYERNIKNRYEPRHNHC